MATTGTVIVPVHVSIEGTCSTCRFLSPATPAMAERWEQRDGAMRKVHAVDAAPANCEHPDDDVVRVDADVDWPDQPGLIIVLQPERFGCTRWAAKP